MVEDSLLALSLPSVQRKKVSAAFDGGRLTSDGGLMLLPLAERRLGVAAKLASEITDPRDPTRILHPLADILRARILAIACGAACPRAGKPDPWEDADDLDHLRTDPCPTEDATCARSPACHAEKTHPPCARSSA